MQKESEVYVDGQVNKEKMLEYMVNLWKIWILSQFFTLFSDFSKKQPENLQIFQVRGSENILDDKHLIDEWKKISEESIEKCNNECKF